MLQPTPVPAAVAAVTSRPVPESLVTLSEGMSFRPTGLGEPHTVHAWSDSFLAGDLDSPILVPLDSWVAPVLSGRLPVAVATLAETGSGDEPVEVVRVDHDAAAASRLAELPDTVAYVRDDTMLYLADSSGVEPFSPAASLVLPGRVGLAEASQLIAERRDPDPGDGSGIGLLIGVLVVVAILVLPVVGLMGLTRSRRQR